MAMINASAELDTIYCAHVAETGVPEGNRRGHPAVLSGKIRNEESKKKGSTDPDSAGRPRRSHPKAASRSFPQRGGIKMKQDGIGSANLTEIKEIMRQMVGKLVRISVKESKPKTHWEEKEGVIEGVYPTVFLFRFKNRRNVDERVAYSYVDVAIDDVKILEN